MPARPTTWFWLTLWALTLSHSALRSISAHGSGATVAEASSAAASCAFACTPLAL